MPVVSKLLRGCRDYDFPCKYDNDWQYFFTTTGYYIHKKEALLVCQNNNVHFEDGFRKNDKI